MCYWCVDSWCSADGRPVDLECYRYHNSLKQNATQVEFTHKLKLLCYQVDEVVRDRDDLVDESRDRSWNIDFMVSPVWKSSKELDFQNFESQETGISTPRMEDSQCLVYNSGSRYIEEREVSEIKQQPSLIWLTLLKIFTWWIFMISLPYKVAKFTTLLPLRWLSLYIWWLVSIYNVTSKYLTQSLTPYLPVRFQKTPPKAPQSIPRLHLKDL